MSDAKKIETENHGDQQRADMQDLSSAERRKLLAQLLASRTGRPRRPSRELESIPQCSRNERLPLSFAQQRLWFLEQMEGELTAYNLPMAVRLRGRLDAESLRRALETIVHRHESLRTTFELRDGEPRQVIQPPTRFELELADISNLSAEPREAEVTRLSREEAERPFDLKTDVMLRATLLRLADDEHVLLLTLHHIATDAWSNGLLWQELATLYGAYRQNQESPLPELPIQYADYAVWQGNELQGSRLQRLLGYWRKQLDGLSALELPTDRPRPPQPSYGGASLQFQLPDQLVGQLQQLSRGEGVTLQMTLLAAFQALLGRYSGQHDIAVGTPIAGRNHAQLENQIGFFVNTLVLRTDLSQATTFRELLARVRQTSLEAYDHQELPFERVVEELQPQRQLSRSPLFQVLFQLLNTADTQLNLPGLEISTLPGDSQRVRFDLEMNLWATRDTMGGTVIYSTDLFEAGTIERLVGHFRKLLEEVVADADQSVEEISLLTDAERHQLLVQWNDTAVDYPREKCVHELFQQQVEQTPDAIAVVFEDQELTYRQLNERANQLAHHLRSLGVGPDTRVGLCLQRSPEAIVAILGILKAGGAYVALDPSHPQERLNFMVQDAAGPVLVTRQTDAARFSAETTSLVCLDADAEKIARHRNSNPGIESAATDPAYVIFTSGSTGPPKGIVGSHRGIINRLCWMWQRYPYSDEDVCCQKTTLSFVDFVAEVLGPLLQGIRSVIIGDEDVKDANRLVEQLAAYGVSRIVLVPSLLQALLNIHPELGHQLPRLKFWVTSGESLPIELWRRFEEQVPQGKLINLYGMTEVAADATCFDAELKSPADSVPIGSPIWNTQAYVLDMHRQPLPMGIPGELHLGGDGLAIGYLNRPELTAEKFVGNPFDDDPNSRLYRTGDRCRWRADGNLEFLGRLDNQIKLRGFRIELGEIETVLNEHADVAQSVVTLREDHADDKRLVAYCVPAAGGALNFSALRSHLRNKLPDYMVPAAFVTLDTLPLTSSGKVNRRGLPAPDDSRPELETSYVAPRTPIEQQLVSTWCEVLGIDEIGVHDNFFALGGHSLLATRVNSRIDSVLQVDLPLRKLFEAPTIAELAGEIETLRDGGQGSRGGTLKRVDRQQLDRLPLSFAQQRLWFLEQMEGELTAYNLPMAVRLRGRLDTESLRRALETIVQRHESLRTTFELRDGEPRQVIQPPARFELELTDISDLRKEPREAEVTRLSREEAERPFDLNTDVMLRAALLRLADDEHVLLLTLHHIASDAWSHGLLWQELATLYGAYRQNQESPLPELPIQYADYAVWQGNELQGPRLQRLLGYWRKQLDGLSALELPTDRPRPPQPSYRGASLQFQLPDQLAGQLQQLSRSEGVTLQMTLLAAFQALLGRYSGQHDIALGTPIAGRNHAQLENQIGFFVNTLVLRTDLSEAATFRELLARVRQTSLEAYDHQELPFERVVEELQPERNLSRNPLIQVMFQLLNNLDSPLNLSGLEVLPLPGSSQRVRFDLELHLWATRDAMGGTVIYSTDLFEAGTMERLVGHFQKLLEELVADADQSLAEVSLLTEAERHQLLVQWNDTAVDFPRDKCVHELFEQQVERTPDATAVVFSDQTLTYGELNARANQLAYHLVELGVGSETMVGLCVERSVEMVVGLLGILKAGGAYVPMDASYPRQRLALMLQDSGAAVVLAQQHLAERLPADVPVVICLDTDWRTIANQRDTNLPQRVAASNLAYVIYTSGSTGRPKGTCIEHRGVVRLVMNNHYAELGPQEVLLQFASISFDASTFEIWGSLLNGAQLVVFPPHMPSLEELADTIEQRGVTTLWLTAALFQQMVETQLHRLRNVRQLLAGGETLSVAHVRRVIETLQDDRRLVNGYGPTENTTFTCCHLMGPGSDLAGSVPIGRPIANTTVYVLDERLNPVPIGVVGELFTGGEGLARGYLNDLELTAQKFLPNPFSNGPAARLYRTGDRCRWRDDGNLEFLGRLDNQVKLRGFRIELGEIETVLNEHAAVAQSVVILREDRTDDKRLVAYLVPADPAGADSAMQEIESEHVTEWQSLYEITYDGPGEAEDEAFDIVGWNSSYTGEPIPAEEMREWVEATVERIRSCRPRRVLEIGCGSGLLLHRLAPNCERYVGTDFSAKVLDQLGRSVANRGLDQVELLFRLATDFEGLDPGSFDTVVLNSVTQYFPSIEYLVRVIEGAAQAVRPGGNIFIGDVRNLPLLSTYHASIELDRAPAGMAADEFERAIRGSVDLERELVVDPGFFHAFCAASRRLDRAQVLLKHGRARNELTGYRYDVILQVGPEREAREVTRWLDWEDGQLDLEALGESLVQAPPAVGVVRIPNARVRRAAHLAGLLRDEEHPETVDALRAAMEATPEGIEVEAVRAVAAEHGYACELSYSRRGGSSRMDAVLWRETPEGAGAADAPAFPETSAAFEPRWRLYANNPVRGRFARRFVPELRQHLTDRLPDYMIPATFSVLDAIPKTPHGKVDRRALPQPDRVRSERVGDLVAPRTPIEQQLASIWCELLALDRIGVNDDFFELGGHSLMAVQLFARIEETFGRKLPLAVLFQHGTISHLANLLAQPGPASDVTSVLPLQPNGDGRTLFLMPGVLGGLMYSRNLVSELKGRFPVIGIQPALAPRDVDQLRDLRTTAGCFISAMQTYQPHGPYALAGYSYGGIMAFEVARLLTELGETVDLLVAFDTGPGRRGLPPKAGDRRNGLSHIVTNLPLWLREEFRDFSARHLLGRATRKWRRLYRVMTTGVQAPIEPEDVLNEDLLHLRNPDVTRASIAAFFNYVPRPYSGKLTLFRAKTRPLLSHSPDDLGWGRFVDTVDVRPINGNHRNILRPPHVRELVRQLGELMDDLASGAPPSRAKHEGRAHAEFNDA